MSFVALVVLCSSLAVLSSSEVLMLWEGPFSSCSIAMAKMKLRGSPDEGTV